MSGAPVGASASVVPPHLWHLLGRVRTLRLETSGDEPGSATGEITVERPDPLTLVWAERGTWDSGPARGLRFWSASRWTTTPAGDGLHLAHLRRGPERPVPLVTFAALGPRHWAALAPHLCGADRYDAALTWNSDSLIVHWRIVGPAGESRLIIRAGDNPTGPTPVPVG